LGYNERAAMARFEQQLMRDAEEQNLARVLAERGMGRSAPQPIRSPKNPELDDILARIDAVLGHGP
jgi:hypothetical protein